ncbi:response regulator [Thermodesulfobacteriota bacterium]
MSAAKPIRILHVEDDQGTARLFQKRMQRAGYEVDLATNGKEGLAKWNSDIYDVLALDHDMPLMTGLEVIRHLAA